MALNIVGIGEVLWDVFPDAAHFGGAPANFACHAAGLGAKAWIVSAVGNDELGVRARQALLERKVACDCLVCDPDHPTGRVLVTLNASGQPSYEIALETAWDHIPWTERMASLAATCDAVCFGSLGQRGDRSRATIRRFLETTRPAALRVFDVNLRQHYYNAEGIESSLRMASAVKLNDEELPIVSRLCGIRQASEREMLRELADRFGLKLAALTRGSRGSILTVGSEVNECPAPPTTVVDTVGAGDAFTAAMVVGFLSGLPLADVNRRSNAVAAYVCSQRGGTPPLPEQWIRRD